MIYLQPRDIYALLIPWGYTSLVCLRLRSWESRDIPPLSVEPPSITFLEICMGDKQYGTKHELLIWCFSGWNSMQETRCTVHDMMVEASGSEESLHNLKWLMQLLLDKYYQYVFFDTVQGKMI